jgi:PPOX class probable F420-dependent enzyme
MMTADPSDRLTHESYISLETLRRNGRAVPTPVWFAPAKGRLYVFSEAKAGKVKRLKNDPTCRVAACDMRGKVRGEWIPGLARRVEDAESVATAYDALHTKYGWLMGLTDFLSRLTGRYDARAIIEIELTPTSN